MANNVSKLITALLEESQNIENALQQLFTQRGIDAAFGDQLDALGRIAGQPRNGLDDDTYRRYVRARIMVHRSTGTINDVINVANLILYDNAAFYLLERLGTASYVLRISSTSITDDLAVILLAFVQKATSAGVRVQIEYSTLNPSAWFQWDVEGKGWDQGAFINAVS